MSLSKLHIVNAHLPTLNWLAQEFRWIGFGESDFEKISVNKHKKCFRGIWLSVKSVYDRFLWGWFCSNFISGLRKILRFYCFWNLHDVELSPSPPRPARQPCGQYAPVAAPERMTVIFEDPKLSLFSSWIITFCWDKYSLSLSLPSATDRTCFCRRSTPPTLTPKSCLRRKCCFRCDSDEILLRFERGLLSLSQSLLLGQAGV